MKTHIAWPGSRLPNIRTYCGRIVHWKRCIDTRCHSIDDATCLSCQRVDDAQQAYRLGDLVMRKIHT